MKITAVHTLVNVRRYRSTAAALREIQDAITKVRWPPGGRAFAIYPESGKARGEGSGVMPIKSAFITALKEHGWQTEVPFPLEGVAGGAQFGAMDAAKRFGPHPYFIVEWETGNISSSHRAMNKMALGLIQGAIAGGVLVVPTQALAFFLTDRIGNERELVPYFPLWRSIEVKRGFLAIMAVEHDRTDTRVSRIPKGTSGRALL